MTTQDLSTCQIQNPGLAPVSSIPVYGYPHFSDLCVSLLARMSCHCVHYVALGLPESSQLQLIMCIADDGTQLVHLLSHICKPGDRLEALTARVPALHVFERDLHERHGIIFDHHPWLKPLRFPEDRADPSTDMDRYPFFRIEGGEVHEIGVGPIHAGVIEPGHFRFICSGEQVLHLEIHNGYQHRGVEQLFVQKKMLLQRNILAEGIAGDSVAGHTLAFAHLVEKLGGIAVDDTLQFERGIFLELERMAIHVGDLSALCTDIAYQLGSAVFGVLRTPLINFVQSWCGNRFGKGLVRAGSRPFALDKRLREKLRQVLDDFESKFRDMAGRMFSLPTVLARFQDCGYVSADQVKLAGAVGMAARMSGLVRDIRATHPFGCFRALGIVPVVQASGDVLARAALRKDEILSAIRWIREALDTLDRQTESLMPALFSGQPSFPPDHFAISLTEGWRGEICHIGVTDRDGQLALYRIKDPSVHNWFILALAMRNQEISDFPINNKSFDLSYCGHDL